jgi:hypothetical protein
MSTTRTQFTFRVDTWTPDGESIVEHVAGIEDYQVALVTYRAACQRWPGIPITLRQGRASNRGQPSPARGIGEFGFSPITGTTCCCALAASVHAAVPPPSRPVNSRLFIQSPRQPAVTLAGHQT